MATAKKRLTLDINPALQRRLKSAAALEGVSMRQFCETVLENALSGNGADEVTERDRQRQAMENMFALTDEVFGGQKVPGNSADIIREERELRAKQIDGSSSRLRILDR